MPQTGGVLLLAAFYLTTWAIPVDVSLSSSFSRCTYVALVSTASVRSEALRCLPGSFPGSFHPRFLRLLRVSWLRHSDRAFHMPSGTMWGCLVVGTHLPAAIPYGLGSA